ncbi:MAG TPA: ABC transporter ATP-binding protein [Chitinophagaceae bacterium]|nr:ABC transporter ATP-binding protein [Chitinophagaceae bacterium]
MKLELQHITKRFGKEHILNEISYVFETPGSYAILGSNGSGKSTLLQVISGYLMPSSGQVTYSINGKALNPDHVFEEVSFCAPYLELIEEMSLHEFLSYHFKFKPSLRSVDDIIEYIGLTKASHKQISNFSSGMKQRVKLAQAIFSKTALLLLDEPCSNLDTAGYELFQKMIDDFGRQRLFIIASNDPLEYSSCQTLLPLSTLNQVPHAGIK